MKIRVLLLPFILTMSGTSLVHANTATGAVCAAAAVYRAEAHELDETLAELRADADRVNERTDAVKKMKADVGVITPLLKFRLDYSKARHDLALSRLLAAVASESCK